MITVKKDAMPTSLVTEAADPLSTVDTDIHLQEILLAASQHDLTTLRHLLRTYSFPDCHSVDVHDPETGFSPLHAAIAACDVDDEEEKLENDGTEPAGSHDGSHNDPQNYSNGLSPKEELVHGAGEVIRCLLQNGAIWNQLDKNNETPGCIALRLGSRDLYGMMVDAGVRAELLLNRLDEYEQLEDEEEDGASQAQDDDDQTAEAETDRIKDVSVNEQYLKSNLTRLGDKLLDEQQNGVMMAWESKIMEISANSLLSQPGLKVLNIGFGMGIIDGFFQDHTNTPASHHVVEAHPSVLEEMRLKGWYEKSEVTIHEGKWQDILPRLVTEGAVFDAIYFDTFAEDYAQFRNFFSEQVIGLLEPSGRWSFFNGMGADRQISYDVYQKLVEMDLFESGFDIDWQEVDVPPLEREWAGVKRKYWTVEKYRLPLCRFMD